MAAERGEVASERQVLKALSRFKVRYLTHLTHKLPVIGNHSDCCFTALASIHELFV